MIGRDIRRRAISVGAVPAVQTNFGPRGDVAGVVPTHTIVMRPTELATILAVVEVGASREPRLALGAREARRTDALVVASIHPASTPVDAGLWAASTI